MSEKIRTDARNIKKLIREAEAVTDETMIACARLRQAMVSARQNPEVPVDAGQRALMRLIQAEQHALSLSSSLLRVHNELNAVNRIMGGAEEETQQMAVLIEDDAPGLQPA